MMVSGIGAMITSGTSSCGTGDHQQIDQDQPNAIGDAHVAEGLVGDLPFAVPFDADS